MKEKEKGSIAIEPQFAIMRIAKYKGPEISKIEAHNERTKEEYKSNPTIDRSRSKDNFHLVEPPQSYRKESERQIKAAGCRAKSNSVQMVEALFTASPEFFKGKTPEEIEAVLNARREVLPEFVGRYSHGLLKLYAEHAVSAMKGAYME